MLNRSVGEHHLDIAIEEIRGYEISETDTDTAAIEFFGKLERSQTLVSAPPKSSWRLPIGMGMAAAAAAFLTWFIVKAGQPSTLVASQGAPATIVMAKETSALAPAPAITQLGTRVAFLAETESRYVIEAMTREATHLLLNEGTLTLRLFPGESAHGLSVSTMEYRFQATGTVYSVARLPVSTILKVYEGSVTVSDANGKTLDTVGAGEVWGSDTEKSTTTNIAATRLLEYQAKSLSAQTKDEIEATVDGGMGTSDGTTSGSESMSHSGRSEEGALSPASDDLPAETWRKARLLRAQSQPARALNVLDGLTSHTDETWAALALIETIRILSEQPVGVSSHRRKMLRAARQLDERFPRHSLIPEVQRIVCPLPGAASVLRGCTKKK